MTQTDWDTSAAAWLAHLGNDGVQQYHRSLNAYMQAFLGAGLTLLSYSEPPFIGGTDALRDRYNRMPWFLMMLWRKPIDT